jgi:Rhodanese-like domain
MSSKRVKKYRGPSRPIDPRYAPGANRKKGPDTFLIALIGISTAFVLIIFLILAGQNNAVSTTTTTTDTSSSSSNSSSSAPTAQSQEVPGAAQTQTEVAFGAETASLPRITPQDAKPVIDGGQAKVVDVRVKNVYGTEHIKGAVNIPYTDAQTRISEFPKTGDIILYCQ